jgi:hypothetical protein
MKICPYCAEEIQENEIVCKRCSGELAPAKAGVYTSPSQARKHNTVSPVVLAVAIVILAYGGTSTTMTCL